MWAFLVVGFIFALTMGYFFLMFFFPEWVGISGEDTQKALKAHKDESLEEPSELNKED